MKKTSGLIVEMLRSSRDSWFSTDGNFTLLIITCIINNFFENMMRLTCLSPLSDFSGVLNYKEIGKNTSQSHLPGKYEGHERSNLQPLVLHC